MKPESRSPSDRVQGILAEIEGEHEAWLELMAGLEAEQLYSRPEGLWSAVDTLIHIAAWKNKALKIARLQAAPDSPTLDPNLSPAGILGINVDRFNQDLIESHHDWTLDRALDWSNEVDADLRATLAALPAERLLGGHGPGGARLWYGRPAIIHPREHRNDLERRSWAPGGR